MRAFGIHGIETDLNSYCEHCERGNEDEFLDKYIGEFHNYGVKTKAHVYSILLTAAIRFNKIDIVKHILSINRGNILTSPDASYSPISAALHSTNEEILLVIEDYIAKYITDPKLKTCYTGGDRANILTAMRYPQTDNMTRERYMALFSPLFIHTTRFVELLDTFEDY